MESGERMVLGSVDEIPFIGASIGGTIIDNIANLVIKQQYVNLSVSKRLTILHDKFPRILLSNVFLSGACLTILMDH